MSKLAEAMELLECRIAQSKVSADNEDYLIQISIKEAEQVLAILKSLQEPAEPEQSEFRQKVAALWMECNADINRSGEISKEHNQKIWQYLNEACDRLDEAEKKNVQQAEEIKQFKSTLKEFADSPQYMHVPNWVVIKCEKVLKESK